MKLYETGIIIDPQLEESQYHSEMESVQSLITASGGQIKRVDRWGMRRMAYQIRKSHQGFYVFFVYKSDGTLPQKLEKSFLLNENIMRFMTVQADWISEEDLSSERGAPSQDHPHTPQGPPQRRY